MSFTVILHAATKETEEAVRPTDREADRARLTERIRQGTARRRSGQGS